MRGVGVGCSQSGGFVQTCLTASHPGCNARSFMLMTLGRVASVGGGWEGVSGWVGGWGRREGQRDASDAGSKGRAARRRVTSGGDGRGVLEEENPGGTGRAGGRHDNSGNSH